MLQVGQIDIANQLHDRKSLVHMKTVNPFLTYHLNQLHFSDMQIQDRQVYYESYGTDVYLTLSA